uniref:Sucrose synthase n=1 Tax=Rhizophora mucronata TaxID=61149 RepID=A0A2P2QUP8_RHIMU
MPLKSRRLMLILNCQRNTFHQITKFKNVEHLKISSSLAPLKFGNILPETIYPSQSH